MASNKFTSTLLDYLAGVSIRPGKRLATILQMNVQREFRKIYRQQLLYSAAFLGRLRSTDPQKIDELYEDLNQMSMQHHKIIVEAEYVQQIFQNLNSIHSIARNMQVVFPKGLYDQSNSKAIMDPDFFPILTLYQIHRELEIIQTKQTLYETASVLIQTKCYQTEQVSEFFEINLQFNTHNQSQKAIKPGQMIGYIPGVIYDAQSSKIFLKQQQIQAKSELPFIVLYNKTLIHYQQELFYPPNYLNYFKQKYSQSFGKFQPVKARPEMINPYAIGHFINHPPEGCSANVCAIEVEIPTYFFPSSLLKYFPYMVNQSSQIGVFTHKPLFFFQILVVVALEELKSGQELFINYGYNRFAGNYRPKWLHTPPDTQPLADYLTKKESLHNFSKMNKLLIKWDDIASTAVESMEREREAKYQRRLVKALESEEVFKKYYDK